VGRSKAVGLDGLVAGGRSVPDSHSGEGLYSTSWKTSYYLGLARTQGVYVVSPPDRGMTPSTNNCTRGYRSPSDVVAAGREPGH